MFKLLTFRIIISKGILFKSSSFCLKMGFCNGWNGEIVKKILQNVMVIVETFN